MKHSLFLFVGKKWYIFIRPFIRPFSMNSWFFFFLFFFFARRDVRDPFFLLLFYFLKLITYSYHLLHFFKYDTKRILCFIKVFPSSTEYLFCALTIYVQTWTITSCVQLQLCDDFRYDFRTEPKDTKGFLNNT